MYEMKTSWEDRKRFLKDVDFKDPLAALEAKKKIEEAKAKYQFEDLSDSDLEMYLFQMAFMEYEELRDAFKAEQVLSMENGEVRLTDDDIMEKLILRDYAYGYYENILSRVNALVKQAPSASSLQAAQTLFGVRNKIAADNKKIVSDILKSYLASATLTNEGYELTNGLTGESHLLSQDSQLSLVLDRSRDMFTFTDRLPRGVHPEPIFNYDVGYWNEYSISVCQSYIDIESELRLKFGAVEQDSEDAEYDSVVGVASFKKCLEEYRDYAESYKISQESVNYGTSQEKKPKH